MKYEDFYKIAGVSQHREFDDYIRKIVFQKEERENFYRDLIAINSDMSVDTFKPYFELYAAERKSHQQDYTPDQVAKILSILTRAKDVSAYDPTAGTGTLLINKWWDDLIQESIFSYAPHRYHYGAVELADNAIPYLIHNCAMRGMNATIVHGDVLERHVKQIYFIQNSEDSFLGFSDVNVMPHSDDVAEVFDVRKWVEEPIEHKESGLITLNFALPMQKERRKPDPNDGITRMEVTE